ITLPFLTRRVAATMSSAVVKLSVPISSFGPHLPQFLYFSAASRRSCRVNFLFDIVAPCRMIGWREMPLPRFPIYCHACRGDDGSTRYQGGRCDNAVPHARCSC